MTVGIVQTWGVFGVSACNCPTLASTPIAGNLIICWLFTDNEATNSIYVNTIGGWIVADGMTVGSNANDQVNGALVYRYADGLSKGLNAVVSGNYGGFALCMGVEVQSVYPTWAGNVIELKHNFGNSSTQHDEISINSGGLSFLGYGYSDRPTTFPAEPTISAGWNVNTKTNGTYQWWELRNKANGGTATVSYAAQGISSWIALVLGDPPPPTDTKRAFPGSTVQRKFPVNTARAFPLT